VNPNISTDITVKELLDRYPQLLQMFMDMELMCVGCPTEAFHTLSDVSREYHLDLNQLFHRIYKVIGDDEASHGLSTPKAMSEQPKTKNNVT
jgi:hybrid cluster-associated redox disulfide protein